MMTELKKAGEFAATTQEQFENEQNSQTKLTALYKENAREGSEKVLELEQRVEGLREEIEKQGG